MSDKFSLKLMFEWGGGCIWCDNEHTRQRFDVGPIEDKLPLSDLVKNRLDELTTWHDQSLNWEYPPDPGPWSQHERNQFEAAALAILDLIRTELGDSFEIRYVPL